MYHVGDPRLLRSQLEQKLTLNETLRRTFLDRFEAHLVSLDLLQAALQPLEIIGPRVVLTGDSLIRILLNVAPIQTEVASLLLERLAGFNEAHPGQPGEAGLPHLILGQFRWLDALIDGNTITKKLLEVLPVCPPGLQRDVISFLPEVASDGEHEIVLTVLSEIAQSDQDLVTAVLDALSGLSLEDRLALNVVEFALGRLQAVNVTDLPAVIRFVLQHSRQSSAARVLSELRSSLHLIAPNDPRIAALDKKGKGVVISGNDMSPEHRLLEAARQALHLNPSIADFILRELRTSSDPLTVFDIWLLLIAYNLGAERRKSVEVLLKRILDVEENAGAALLSKAVTGHSCALMAFFPSLLMLGQILLRSPLERVRNAACSLYKALFLEFEAPYHRQDILRALHSHLGAHGSKGEASAALCLLHDLASAHPAILLRYAAFLTSILDHVGAYDDESQAVTVFKLFGELTVAACLFQDSGDSMSEHGSRMEDEVLIFVRKQMSSPDSSHRRIGVIGIVALLERLGREVEHSLQNENSVVGKRYSELLVMVQQALEIPMRGGDRIVFSFLCDELKKAVCKGGVFKTLIKDIVVKMSESLEDIFIADVVANRIQGSHAMATVGGEPLVASLWFGLDGPGNPAAMNILLLLTSLEKDGGASWMPNVSRLEYVFPMFKLLAATELALHGDLGNIDALLGCPMCLYDASFVSPSGFGNLPSSRLKEAVLSGLYYCDSWLRELLNAFGSQLTPGNSLDQTSIKLFARTLQLCQVEQVLFNLLPHAPNGCVLPSVAGGRNTRALKKAKTKAKNKAKCEGDKEEEDEMSDEEHCDHRENPQNHEGPQNEKATSASMARDSVNFTSLMLPAFKVLSMFGGSEDKICYGALPGVAFMLEQVARNLQVALAKPKKKLPFMRPVTKTAVSSKLPPDEVLNQVLLLLPYIRKHLEVAFSVQTDRLTDEEMAAADKAAYWAPLSQNQTSQVSSTLLDACQTPSLRSSVAEAAMSPSLAAPKVILTALNCVSELLLTFAERQSSMGPSSGGVHPAVSAVLSSFADQNPMPNTSDGPVSSGDYISALSSTFIFFSQHIPEDLGECTPDVPLDQMHALLVVMEGIVMSAQKIERDSDVPLLAEDVKRVRRLCLRLHEAAESVLKTDWSPPTSQKHHRGGSEFGWKGKGSKLANLIGMHLTHSQNNLVLIEELVRGPLALVPGEVQGTVILEGVPPYPSLSGSTIAVWYKTVLDIFLRHWNGVISTCVAADKEKIVFDDQTMDHLVQETDTIANIFAALMNIVKIQDKRVVLHTQAVYGCGKFLENFLKMLPRWSQEYSRRAHMFVEIIKKLQKGARTVQVLCVEGKTHTSMPVTAKVPQVKKIIEKFNLELRAFFASVGQGGALELAVLKHKDLQGREQPSQMYFGYDEEEEEEEETRDIDEGMDESAIH